MPELKPIHNYRIDFPIAGETERKRLQLMERITDLKKELEKKGHKGKKGLRNLTCYAPYSNAAVCLVSTMGEEDWLEKEIFDIKKNSRPDDWESKLFVAKAYINSFKPTRAKLEEETVWYESIKERMGLKKFYEQYVVGEPELMTERAAEAKKEEETKRLKEILLQQPLDVGNGEIHQPHVIIKKEVKTTGRKFIEKEDKIRKELQK